MRHEGKDDSYRRLMSCVYIVFCRQWQSLCEAEAHIIMRVVLSLVVSGV